jgi:hypothetical protein
MNPKLIIIGIMWSIFLIVIIRNTYTGRLASAPSKRIMVQVFLTCLALSLWGEDNERVVDSLLGLPDSAVYIKGLALIWAVHLFDVSCRAIVPEQADKHPWTPHLAPAATGIAILSYGLTHTMYPISQETMRYVIIGGRDFIVALYMLFSLIPSVAIMHQRENIVAMRFKFAAIQIVCLCFMVTTASSLAAAGLAVLHIGSPAYAALAGQPFVVFGALVYIVVMIPYRWLLVLFSLERLMLYRRLCRLEQHVLQDIEDFRDMGGARLFASDDDLELAIYRKLITILDFYPTLAQKPDGRWLFEAIQQRVEAQFDYNRLVREIAWVRL